MPEAIATEATDSSSLAHLASVFEREESGEPDHTDADESQQEQTVGDEQPEQPIEDEVVEDAEDAANNDDLGESDPEEEDAAAVAEPRKLKVKLPEGEQELPEDEVVKGYLRQADYTRKTQAHAENVKAFDGEKTAVSAERQQIATALTQLHEALKQQTPQEPDWEKLQQENPNEFAVTWAAWQRHTQDLARLDQARKDAIEKVTRDQIEHLNKHLASEQEKLVEAIPAWKDPAVAKKEREQLFEYAQAAGYTEAELDEVRDHRVMVILRKAHLYDEAQKRRPAVQKKIERVRVATPGPAASTRRPPVSDLTRAKQRLAKTGDVRDAAAVFELMD